MHPNLCAQLKIFFVVSDSLVLVLPKFSRYFQQSIERISMTQTQERIAFAIILIGAIVFAWTNGVDTSNLCSDTKNFIEASSDPAAVYQGLGSSYQGNLTDICGYNGP